MKPLAALAHLPELALLACLARLLILPDWPVVVALVACSGLLGLRAWTGRVRDEALGRLGEIERAISDLRVEVPKLVERVTYVENRTRPVNGR